MFSIDEYTLKGVLTILFNKIWGPGKIPFDWNRGMVVKIPKKERPE